MAKKNTQPKNTPVQSTPASQSWKVWVPVVAAVVMYFITLSYPLLGLDDHAATVENKAVTDFSLFETFAHLNLGMYAPLTWMAYAIPNALGGDHGLGYHLLNLLVHAVNTWLVTRLLVRLNIQEALRFPIAFLFAVHPIQAESVAWVAGFSTPFYVLFCLLGLLFYQHYNKNTDGTALKWYGLAILMMILGNLAKSAAVVFPLLLVVLDWWQKPEKTLQKRIIAYAPFFLVALAFGILTIYSRNASGTPVGAGSNGYSGVERFLMVCYAPLLYLYKTIFPLNLNVYYSFNKVNGQLPWQYWAAPVVIAGITWLALKYRKTIPGLYIGLAFFMANIFITLPFVTLGTFELCADHYNYLACVGVFWALGSVILYLSDRMPSRAALISRVAIGWMVFIAILGFRQVGFWKDTISVISQAIDNGFYHNGMMYFGRGVEYGDLNQPQKAIDDFTKAIELNPEMRDAYKFRGSLYAQAGQIDLAVKDLEKYLTYDPTDVVTWNNMAMIYMRQNKLQDALNAFNKTIELKPDAAISYQNRAKIYEMMGNATAANADMQKAKEVSQNRKK